MSDKLHLDCSFTVALSVLPLDLSKDLLEGDNMVHRVLQRLIVKYVSILTEF